MVQNVGQLRNMSKNMSIINENAEMNEWKTLKDRVKNECNRRK